MRSDLTGLVRCGIYTTVYVVNSVYISYTCDLSSPRSAPPWRSTRRARYRTRDILAPERLFRLEPQRFEKRSALELEKEDS